MFFSLDSFTLRLVFNQYGREYGHGKRKYAETTFAKWKSGRVEMSGEVSERLIKIVPAFLSFEQKYTLIHKLWSNLRQKTALHVTISPSSGLDSAMDAVLSAIDAISDQEIPAVVAERLEWLAADDAVAAQALLGQVAKRDAEIATQRLDQELRQLLSIAQQNPGMLVSGTRQVDLPGAIVNIHVSQSSTSGTRKPYMSSEQHGRSSEDDRQELSTRRDEGSRELSPIQNPNDLLSEALKRMSAKKQEEIIGKAGDEALRLQVKQKEGEVDHEMASSKIDQVVEGARRASGAGEFHSEGEHRSEHGYVKLSVRSKPTPFSERVGRCFVATACFGDYSHPAVVELRAFRDTSLRSSRKGRAFIAWYYRNSPSFARRIENHAPLRVLVRIALWPLVSVARIANRRNRSAVRPDASFCGASTFLRLDERRGEPLASVLRDVGGPPQSNKFNVDVQVLDKDVRKDSPVLVAFQDTNILEAQADALSTDQLV